MKAKVDDIIKWSFPENHGSCLAGKTFQAEVLIVADDEQWYGVVAEYGQDKIPFEAAQIVIVNDEALQDYADRYLIEKFGASTGNKDVRDALIHGFNLNKK